MIRVMPLGLPELAKHLCQILHPIAVGQTNSGLLQLSLQSSTNILSVRDRARL